MSDVDRYKLYKALFESAAEGILVADPKTLRFRYANPAICNLLGYELEEMLELSVRKIHPEDSLEATLAEFSSQSKGEKVLASNIACLRKDGDILFADINTTMVELEGSECVVGFFTDITERKQAEDALRESEARYRSLFYLSPESITLVGPDGVIIDCNDATSQIAHISRDGLVGKHFSELGLFSEDELRACNQLLEALLAGGKPDPFEVKLTGGDGEPLWVEIFPSLISMDGEARAVQVISRDITKRRSTEELLMHRLTFEGALSRISAIFASLENPNIDEVLELLGKAVSSNRAYLFCYDSDTNTISNTHEWCAEGTCTELAQSQNIDVDLVPNWKELLFRGDIITLNDIAELPEDAPERRVVGDARSLLIVPIHSKNFKPLGFIGFDDTEKPRDWKVQDAGMLRVVGEMIATQFEREEAHIELQTNEERYQLATEAARVGVWDWNVVTQEFYLDPTIKSFLGYQTEDVPDKLESWLKHVHPEDRQAAVEAAKACMDGMLPEYSGEHRVVHRDGSIRWVQLNVKVIRDEKDRALRIVGTGADITKRKNIELALAESEAKFRELANSLPQTIFEADLDGHITYTNPHGFKNFGYSSDDLLSEVSLFDIIIPDDRKKATKNIRKILKGGKTHGQEYTAQRKDGSTFPAVIYSNPILKQGQVVGIRGLVVDISEHKQLEDELRRHAKMESVGRLAGGIAHDGNNLVGAIMANISLARMSEDENEREEILREAEKACGRLAKLNRQLLTFSKGGAPVKKTASLMEMLHGVTAFALRGSSTSAEFRIPQDLHPCDIDVDQISEVIQNIVVNARQSMPGGGRILVNADNVAIGADTLMPLSEGRYVKLSFSDEGTGIPSNILPKIFDPYFTTKTEGHGLGLAASYSIVEKHKGHLAVESETGKGTTFHIYLPASDKEPIPETEKTDGIIRGSGRILVMDDEKPIRAIARLILQKAGYECVCAKEGEEALQLYREAMESGNPFRAVVLDITVRKGKGGEWTIQKLKKIDPEVKAIVSSGYSESPILGNYQEYGFNAGLKKPYNTKGMTEVLHSVLNEDES